MSWWDDGPDVLGDGPADLLRAAWRRILAQRGEVPNFASFLRVTCMRYLRRAAEAAESSAGVPRLAVVPAAVQRRT